MTANAAPEDALAAFERVRTELTKNWAQWDATHGGSGGSTTASGKPRKTTRADAAAAFQRAHDTLVQMRSGKKKPTKAELTNAHLVHMNHMRQVRAGRAKKGARNPRDTGSGRFRTFQGEMQEAKQALAEGRMDDVVELLGSARALAQTDQQRLALGELQGAIGRVQHVQPELTKTGPGGYSHGWVRAAAQLSDAMPNLNHPDPKVRAAARQKVGSVRDALGGHRAAAHLSDAVSELTSDDPKVRANAQRKVGVVRDALASGQVA
jgi:hypothetical protein